MYLLSLNIKCRKDVDFENQGYSNCDNNMDTLKYSEILRANTQRKAQLVHLPSYRIKVLSNITCIQLAGILEYHLSQQQINAVIEYGNFDTITQDSFLLKGYDLVIVHYELLSVLEKRGTYYEQFTTDEIHKIQEALISELEIILRNISGVPCAIIDSFTSQCMPIHPLRQNQIQVLADALNDFIQTHKHTNTYWIDTRELYDQIGYKQAIDCKLYNLSKTLYTLTYWKEYVYMISPLVLKVTGHAKKVIVFDCDNTLWHGILGEDGADGIDMSFHSKIGSIYHNVQQFAVWLSQNGVLIGICSKNNREDVENILSSHEAMVLRNENIVVSKINWTDKVTNLREIAVELNIGLDSMVFVDDSAFEINLIRQQLPEVLCVQVPEALYEYPNTLKKIVNTYFFLSNSKEDKEKTIQYKQQKQRELLKNSCSDIESFLSSLEIEIECHIDRLEDAERVSQLTQKTNQFNLCTNRYTLAQIQEFLISREQEYLTISVRDKFGDSGLTGVVLLQYLSAQAVVITDLLMSCRILGRNIEFAIMDYLIRYLSAKQMAEVYASYCATTKNKLVADFYDRVGFTCVSENVTIKKYHLQISNYKYQNIKYISTK